MHDLLPSAETIAKVAIMLLASVPAVSAGWLLFRRGHRVLALVVTMASGVLALPFAIVIVLVVSFQVFGVDLID